MRRIREFLDLNTVPNHQIRHLDGTFCNINLDMPAFWGTAPYVERARFMQFDNELTVDGVDIYVHAGWSGPAVVRWILEQAEPRFKDEWRKLMPPEIREARSPPFEPDSESVREDPKIIW